MLLPHLCHLPQFLPQIQLRPHHGVSIMYVHTEHVGNESEFENGIIRKILKFENGFKNATKDAWVQLLDYFSVMAFGIWSSHVIYNYNCCCYLDGAKRKSISRVL